jgi:NADPH-dependent curcumin reductase CurA
MQQVVLASYARGVPQQSDFRVERAPVPEAGDGELLLRTLWLALDPLIRFAIDEEVITGVVRLQPGDVMYGPTVSEVAASNHPDYAPGDIVETRTGWSEFAVVTPDKADYRGPPRKLDAALAPVQTALGALGMPGQTAYAGIVDTARVKAGETVVVSAAAGAVGSIAGQIARALGARAVGIAGGADKCAALLDLGFDAVADYKAADFEAQLAAALPDEADVYFDSTGGDVTFAVLPRLKRGARMAVCGFMAYQNMGMEGPGPDRMPAFYRLINSKGLEIRGFSSFFAGGAALEQIAGWMQEGHITFPEAIVEGLEAAPEAFSSVFAGNSFVGKLLVRVAQDA